MVIPQADPASFRYNDVHLEANAVIRLLSGPEVSGLILDFSLADYASSLIIGSLIRMARKVTDHGGKAVMCCATENMRDILGTMRLFRLWPHYETRDAAFEALSEAVPEGNE